MPDLWKALGDVYGEADARSVPVEPAAGERSGNPAVNLPLDDDLAAALSAALVHSATPPAPAPTVAPAAPVPMPVAPPPAAVAAAPVAPPVTAPPVYAAPVAAAPPVEGAQVAVTAWLADLQERQKVRDLAPTTPPAFQAETWHRGDDDILPTNTSGKKPRRRKR